MLNYYSQLRYSLVHYTRTFNSMTKRSMSINGTTTIKTSSYPNWNILAQTTLPANITLTKYQSARTLLQVVRAAVPGPICNGYFTLGTESLSDNGCPHTLEHLVFMGSELYPYKGILDQLANRCLSHGTNAWTDIDHTTYTLETVGSDGFIQLLPVYLDHILYPTLNDSAYDTEVHHITKLGANAGVVYSEMQARENTYDSIIERMMYRTLYKHGVSGYASETGGMLHDIRLLDNNTIKQYHASYYQPNNLTLIITGDIDDTKLFHVLSEYESQQILSKPAIQHIERPFSTPVEPITETIHKSIEFASDDESIGFVELGWFIVPYNQFEIKLALSILFDYFTANSTSYLQHIFCECSEPYCNSIDYNMTQHKYSVHTIEFDNVPTGRLDEIVPLLMQSLQSHQIEISRIHTSIHKYIRSTNDTFETNVHEFICRIAIPDFLYCNLNQQQDELDQLSHTVDIYNKLLDKSIDYWSELLQKYIINNSYVAITARPSKLLGKQQRDIELQRIQSQKSSLLSNNANALIELDDKLQKSIEINSIPVPDNIIHSFDIPDITRISTIQIDTIKQGGNDIHNQSVSDIISSQSIRFDQIPFTVQINHIHTQFISIRLLLDTVTLTEQQRLLLPLYRELMYESNIIDRRTNQLIPYSDVIDLLEQNTVHYDNSTGLNSYRYTCGTLQQYISISLKVESTYGLDGLLHLLYNIVYNIQYTIDRVTVCIKRMLSDIPSMKNDGSTVLKSISQQQNYNSSSNIYNSNFIRQQLYLKHVLSQITVYNDTSVIDELHELTNTLTDINKLKMHLVLDITRHQNNDHLYSAIASFVPDRTAHTSSIGRVNDNIINTSQYYINDVSCNQQGTATDLISISAVESNYLLSTTSLHGLTYHDLHTIATIRVCIEYLTALEGPMWKRIRGLGLSYSYSIRIDIDTQLLYFSLYKSTSLMSAYSEAYNIVNEYVTNQSSFNDIDLIAAKNSLVYEILSVADTPSSAAEQSFIHSLHNLSNTYIHDILQHIQSITASDCIDILQKYILPVFTSDNTTTRIAITTNPNNTQSIIDEFHSKYNRTVSSSDDLYLYFTGKSVVVDESDDVAEDEESDEEDSDEEDSEMSDTTQ